MDDTIKKMRSKNSGLCRMYSNEIPIHQKHEEYESEEDNITNFKEETDDSESDDWDDWDNDQELFDLLAQEFSNFLLEYQKMSFSTEFHNARKWLGIESQFDTKYDEVVAKLNDVEAGIIRWLFAREKNCK